MTDAPEVRPQPEVRLDVWADIACPWCYIGTRRLQVVLDLERSEGRPVRAVHRPFELQPGLPAEGVPWQAFADDRFGGPQAAAELFDHVTEYGANVGIAFDLTAVTKAPNTRLAHALVLSYDDTDVQRQVLLSLYSAYFEQGLDVTDLGVLARVVAEETGEAYDDVSARTRDQDSLDRGLRLGWELGVDAVPMFVADAGEPRGELGLSAAAVAVQGAQPERRLLRLLEQARERAATAV